MGLLELSRGQRVEASLPPKPPVYQPLGSWSLFSTSLVLEKDWFEITGIVQLMLLFPLKKKKRGLQRACCEICVNRNPLLVMQSPNRGESFSLALGSVSYFLEKKSNPNLKNINKVECENVSETKKGFFPELLV